MIVCVYYRTVNKFSLKADFIYLVLVHLFISDSSSSGPLVRELEMSLYYYKDQCSQLKTLIKQQQGRGYNFQPVYQQLQDQDTSREKPATRHHQQAVERRPTGTIIQENIGY